MAMPVKTPLQRHTHSPRHKHTKKYLETYWPYLPMAGLVIAILALSGPGSVQRLTKQSTLATNLSSGTLLATTNNQREKFRLSSLDNSQQLNRAAQAKAEDMVKRDYWSHDTPDGQVPWSFVQKAGYSYERAGENLAYGFKDANGVVKGWLTSQSHRANLLDKNYTEVGFGVANAQNFHGQGPKMVVVALYGKPAKVSAVAGARTSAFSFPSQTTHISNLAWLSNGRLAWLGIVVVIIMCLAIIGLLMHHGAGWRRLWRNTERVVAKHPLLDFTAVVVIAISYFLTYVRGSIY